MFRGGVPVFQVFQVFSMNIETDVKCCCIKASWSAPQTETDESGTIFSEWKRSPR